MCGIFQFPIFLHSSIILAIFLQCTLLIGALLLLALKSQCVSLTYLVLFLQDLLKNFPAFNVCSSSLFQNSFGFAWVHVWILYSFPLVYSLIFMTLKFYFVYYGFVMCLEVRYCDDSSFVLLFNAALYG
jgi:hypothetical protein